MIKQFFRVASPVLKGAGKAMDNAGQMMEAVPVIESLVPSTRNATFKGTSPKTADDCFVAPTASVIGNVEIGAGSSIWYGAKVRGDVHSIKIGASTSIGDNSMVHVAKIQGDFPTVIGDNVTVEANAIVHACTIESLSVIGTGAQVLDGATVKSNSIVAPGAVVTPGTTVASGQLWSGSPAKHLRDLTAEEIDGIKVMADEAVGLSAAHAAECAKSYEQVEEDLADHEDDLIRHPDYFPKVPKGEAAEDEYMGRGAPGLIFNSKLQEVVDPKEKATW